MKYVFPAIFTEDEGVFAIRFPDVEGYCNRENEFVTYITCDTLQDALRAKLSLE